MSAPGPILGDVVAPAPRPPRRASSRAAAKPITSASEAERRVESAERDLEFLARELSRVASEGEARAAALRAAHDDCARIGARLATVEQLVGGVGAVIAADRAQAAELVRDAHDQAAAAIRLAEEHASAAIRAAHATLAAAAAPVEPVTEVQAGPTALERRLEAELELVRRERAEHEARLRAELDLATNEKLELRTRLGLCEHDLREREDDLRRERQLADEALRWASSVERELAQGGPAPVSEDDVPAEQQVTALRRRATRVRLRTAS